MSGLLWLDRGPISELSRRIVRLLDDDAIVIFNQSVGNLAMIDQVVAAVRVPSERQAA